VIIGSLYGEAYAGAGGDDSHFVIALKFEPQRCKIGDVRYTGAKEKGGLFANKNKFVPQIAFVKNNEIQVENITKELPVNYSL
jgi:septum site-determining protein MinC